MSYAVGIEREQQRRGRAAAYIASTIDAPVEFATLTNSVRADRYRGRRHRWTGWVRHTDVQGTGAGLWMRVDGPGVTQAFDNMTGRFMRGSSDWRREAVVLDVPANAIGIAFGVLLIGRGDVVLDDFRLEIVGADVPSTDLWTR